MLYGVCVCVCVCVCVSVCVCVAIQEQTTTFPLTCSSDSYNILTSFLGHAEGRNNVPYSHVPWGQR